MSTRAIRHILRVASVCVLGWLDFKLWRRYALTLYFYHLNCRPAGGNLVEWTARSTGLLWRGSLDISNMCFWKIHSTLPVRSRRTRGPNSVTHAHIQHELADKRKRKRGWITNTTSSYTILSTSGLIYLTGKQSQLKFVSFCFFCAYKQNEILKGNGLKSCGEFPDAASLAETVAILFVRRGSCEAPRRHQRGDGGWSGGRTAIFSAVPHINARREQFYWRGVQPRKWSRATVFIASVVELHGGSCAQSVGGEKKGGYQCVLNVLFKKKKDSRGSCSNETAAVFGESLWTGARSSSAHLSLQLLLRAAAVCLCTGAAESWEIGNRENMEIKQKASVLSFETDPGSNLRVKQRNQASSRCACLSVSGGFTQETSDTSSCPGSRLSTSIRV